MQKRLFLLMYIEYQNQLFLSIPFLHFLKKLFHQDAACNLVQVRATRRRSKSVIC